MINIIIDNKENKSFVDILKKYISFDIKSLHVGDIVFQTILKDGTSKDILYIERKTINDLAASLNDGRYHEQKARLKTVNSLYLIEGSYTELDKQYNKTFTIEKYKGCILNTILRDKIPVYKSKNMEESAELIADIYKRLPKYCDLLIQKVNDNNNIQSNDIEYSNSIKIKKKDNITSTVCFINQLRQIPGVSAMIAQNVVEKYKNMSELIKSYMEIEEEKDREKMLKDIQINQKKLGPVLSKKIYNYLC